MENLAGSLNVLGEDEIKTIHAGSLQILEDTGLEVPLDSLLDRLSQFGLKVDDKKKRVFFRADIVEKAVDSTPSSFTWHARNPEYNIIVGQNQVSYGIASTISTVVDLDGLRRPATIEDAKNLSRLTNKLKYINDGYCGVWPTDVPAGSEHAYMMYAQFSQSEKPGRGRLHGIKQAQDCIAMAEIIAGGARELKEKPFLLGLYSPFSPLSHTREQLEGGLEYIKNGQILIICPGIYAGATGPVTLAGLLTQQNAEFLGLLTIAQLISRGALIGYGNFSSMLDMRTGAGPMATPEACLINSAVAQLGRFYDVPSRGYGGTDSNVPDMQAGFENALKVATASLSGCNIISHSAGFMDGGRALSYETLFADNEIISFVRRILQGIKVDEETMALNLIKRIGPGGSYLAESHTIEHMRDEGFMPELSNRETYDEWKKEGEKSLSQKANEKVREILKNFQPGPLESFVEKELRNFVKEVEKRLIKEK